MKTLIIFFLLSILSCPLGAQNTYDIFVKAYECIDEYDYINSKNLHINLNAKVKLNKSKKNGIKIISNALMEAGFKFDLNNDTLLLECVYEDYVVGGIPCCIYAQSSEMVKILTIDSYSELNYTEQSKPSSWNNSYYSMLYSGHVKDINAFLLTKGKTLGCFSVAIRVVIQSGKIIPPSILWKYGYIMPQYNDKFKAIQLLEH